MQNDYINRKWVSGACNDKAWDVWNLVCIKSWNLECYDNGFHMAPKGKEWNKQSKTIRILKFPEIILNAINPVNKDFRNLLDVGNKIGRLQPTTPPLTAV